MFVRHQQLVTSGEAQEFLLQKEGSYGGVKCNSWAFQCCGTATIQGLGNVALRDYVEKAEWLAALYRELYAPGNVFYVIKEGTDEQLSTHRALLEIGAVKISRFANLMHGPAVLSMWQVNIRNGVGIFYDKYGNPFKEPPAVVPDVPAIVVTPQSHDWHILPKQPEKQDEQPA